MIDVDLVNAIAWCHLGSSKTERPSEGGFRRAEQLGLLKHHPTWHATERGIGVLIAAGRMEGELAPETVTVHVRWARHSDRFPGTGLAQFIGAWPDGLVDMQPETYDEEREAAEAAYRDWFDDPCAVAEFFTTVERIPRPALESRPREGEAASTTEGTGSFGA